MIDGLRGVVRLLLIIVLLMGFGIVRGAHGQADTDALLRQFIAEPNYQAAVLANARKQAAALPDHCADVISADGKYDIEVVEQVAFEKRNDRFFPSKGAWVEHLEADVCGARRRLNILSIAKGRGSVDILPLYRGTTRGDAILQRDATQSVITYASLAASRAGGADCNSAVIVDTRFLALDDKPQPQVMPGRSPYAWHEIWTIDVCGKAIEAAIDFVPDPSGTGFDVHSPGAKK